jgi:hypothetical protein
MMRRYTFRGGYVRGEVLPALAERGLYTRQWRRVLGVLPVARWILSPAGETLKADLKADLKSSLTGANPLPRHDAMWTLASDLLAPQWEDLATFWTTLAYISAAVHSADADMHSDGG